MFNIVGVKVNDDALTVALNDGRDISAPLAWFPQALAGHTKGTGQLAIDWEGLGYPLGRPGGGH